MGKSFKENKPIENLTATAGEPKVAVVELTPAEPKPEIKKTAPAKKKVGRPKKIEVERKNINIAVPVYLLEQYDEVKKALGGNQTAYIVNLIKKDMEENYEKYKGIARLQEEMGL